MVFCAGEVALPEGLDDLLDCVSIRVAAVERDRVLGLVAGLLDRIDEIADVEARLDRIAAARIDERALPKQRCQPREIPALARTKMAPGRTTTRRRPDACSCQPR